MLAWLMVIGGVLGCQEYSLGNEEPEQPAETPDKETDLGPPGEAPMYANAASQLFAVDPSSDSIERVGAFELQGVPVERFVDMAMDGEGRLFGGTYDAIYEIGPTTASLRYHCATTADLTAMAFDADGTLYVGGESTIQRLNLNDCSLETVFEGPEYETSGDLVGTPDGALYWSVTGDGEDELVRLDPTDGSIEWVRKLGAQRLYGLGYMNGDVYGFSSFGKVVQASLVPTEAPHIIASVDEAWWGATANPSRW